MASAIVDNLIAWRVLSLLVTPFTETEAFKLGIIDKDGKNLIPSSKFTTQKQKDAYDYLHRLVFNLKKILNRLPGGDSKMKNLVAAFWLVREAYESKSVSINEQDLIKLLEILDNGVVLVEEQLVVEEFLLMEDGEGGGAAPAASGPANVTGKGVSTDIPVIRRKKRRFARFTVNDDVFNKFSAGKAKFRKWGEYLNLEDDGQRLIYNFAKKNPNGVIILHNGKATKSIRFNRCGGGSWSKIKRPVKQIANEVI